MECECGRAIIVRLIGSPDSLGLIIFAFVVAGRLSYDSLGVQIAWGLLFVLFLRVSVAGQLSYDSSGVQIAWGLLFLSVSVASRETTTDD